MSKGAQLSRVTHHLCCTLQVVSPNYTLKPLKGQSPVSAKAHIAFTLCVSHSLHFDHNAYKAQSGRSGTSI